MNRIITILISVLTGCFMLAMLVIGVLFPIGVILHIINQFNL